MGNQCNQCNNAEISYESAACATDPVHQQGQRFSRGTSRKSFQILQDELPRLMFGNQSSKELQVVGKEPPKLTNTDGMHPVSSTPIKSMKSSALRHKHAAKFINRCETAHLVAVVFDDLQGCERMMKLFKRPLGADFTKLPFGPTKISHVTPKSYACGLGLEVGWVIKAVDGEDMSKKTFEEIQAAVKRSMEKLPLCVPVDQNIGTLHSALEAA